MPNVHDMKARTILQYARWAPLRLSPDGSSYSMMEMDCRNDIAKALKEASDKEQERIIGKINNFSWDGVRYTRYIAMMNAIRN